MNRGPVLFLGLLGAIALSWFGLVIGPALQLGHEQPVTLAETDQEYPLARSGQAAQGAEVYRANGCYYCHTQQVRPRSAGADLARGWGTRRTVARDYLRDQPVMLGQYRFGPDLANLGARQPDTAGLLLRLYNPRILMPGSIMPRYPYLFERRHLAPGHPPSPNALRLPPPFAPPPGIEIVPKPAALELTAYLESLKAEALFLEAYPPAHTPGRDSSPRGTGLSGSRMLGYWLIPRSEPSRPRADGAEQPPPPPTTGWQPSKPSFRPLPAGGDDPARRPDQKCTGATQGYRIAATACVILIALGL